MSDLSPEEELTQLKRELSKLKLEANLRKSLSTQQAQRNRRSGQGRSVKKSEELGVSLEN